MVTVTKLVRRPYLLSFSIFSSRPFFCIKPSRPKLSIVSFFSTADTTQSLALSYGPSLHKGTKPSQSLLKISDQFKEEHQEEEERVLDEESFTRIFDISALRVPASDCFALENRIRGHLLNWPRIRNIARVPGDEMDEGFSKLLGEKRDNTEDDDENNLKPLNRRLYGKAEGDGERLSPVLYREELVKTFDSRGFAKFSNLAKMSRPKTKKKKRKEDEGIEEKKGHGKNSFATVEVIEDIEEAEDLSGLLGDEFKGRKWKGSTRLLLLGEQYADRDVEDMPEAIKVVLKDGTGQSTTSTFELVRCKLTLFYNYWLITEILEAMLPNGMIVPSAFETVGHIAHLNLREEHLPYKKFIAKVILDKNKPKIRTVVNKVDAIQNEYRTMQLEVLAGNHSLVTTVVENGLAFHVDLATVYWNSRLATERQRLLSFFTHNDVICDVFSGVGPIAIFAAKKVRRVYANDLNPKAIEYLEKNSVDNKVERKIEVFNMDGRRFINAMFTSPKSHSITHVVMNLPNDAAEFLDVFRGVYSKKLKDKYYRLPMIHVYGFSRAEDPEFDFHKRIRIALSEVGVDVKMHRVRLVAPGKWMLCASFLLPESVAFAKTMLNV